jgi:DNA-binding MarR family transcriptional regulator
MYAMRTDKLPGADIAGGGPALFQLVRFWSRRWAAGGVLTPPGGSAASGSAAGGHADMGHVLVLEAIDAAAAHGPAAIGDVAIELGLDRSNASRMLAAAVAAGLVAKTVSPGDSRRTELQITAGGSALLSAARTWQQDRFTQLTAGWPARDARQFAGYLQRLAAESRQVTPSRQNAESRQNAPSRQPGRPPRRTAQQPTDQGDHR